MASHDEQQILLSSLFLCLQYQPKDHSYDIVAVKDLNEKSKQEIEIVPDPSESKLSLLGHTHNILYTLNYSFRTAQDNRLSARGQRSMPLRGNNV